MRNSSSASFSFTPRLATLALSVALSAAAAPALAQVMVGGASMLPSRDIIDNAVNSKDHTTLVAAVKAAGLVDTLKGAGPFTVFAPTNMAFDALPAGTVDTLLQPANKPTLTKVLTYHVVAGRIDAATLERDIAAGGGKATLHTVSGGTLTAMNGDGGIEFSDREEAPVAKSRQNPTLNDLHTDFSLGLILRLSGPSGQDHRAVVVGEFGRCSIERRFITVGDGNQGARIIRNNQSGRTADKRQGAADAGEPVVLRLSRRRTGEGVARCAEHGDEDAGRADLAATRVDDRHRRPGIVREQLLAGTVNLAHRSLQLASPGFVAGAEGGVLITAPADRLQILLPKQGQGDAFLLQFLMNHGVVGFGIGRLADGNLSVEQLLQSGIVKLVGQRPVQPGNAGQTDVFGDDTFRQVKRSGNRLQAEPGAVAVAEYVSYLAHG